VSDFKVLAWIAAFSPKRADAHPLSGLTPALSPQPTFFTGD
jgi:hypothetical protein